MGYESEDHGRQVGRSEHEPRYLKGPENYGYGRRTRVGNAIDGVFVVIILGILAAIIVPQFSSSSRRQRDSLYNAAAIAVDVDRSGLPPSHSEWDSAYQKFGMVYNKESSDPREDFSDAQLGRIPAFYSVGLESD